MLGQPPARQVRTVFGLALLLGKSENRMEGASLQSTFCEPIKETEPERIHNASFPKAQHNQNKIQRALQECRASKEEGFACGSPPESKCERLPHSRHCKEGHNSDPSNKSILFSLRNTEEQEGRQRKEGAEVSVPLTKSHTHLHVRFARSGADRPHA